MKPSVTFFRAMIWPVLAAFVAAGCAQGRHDKVVFVGSDGAEHDVMQASAKRPGRRHRPSGGLRPSMSGVDHPTSLAEFHPLWHERCICQDNTGQCWAFAGTSFMESEIHRVTGRDVKLSQAWTVYWDYVGKAERFIRKHGDSFFANGSEPNSLLRVWNQYGMVPFDAYTGLLPGQKYYDDGKLYDEMLACLNAMKAKSDWDEAKAVKSIREILDRHMGAPPEKFDVDGKSVTPKQYAQSFTGLDAGECVSLLSLMQEPWYEWVLYDVPDNWWRSHAYYNVPLADYTRVLRAAVKGGYTVCLLEDNSEAGFYGRQGIAIVPSFDIPAAYIDDSARQFRFSNGTTGDDHAVHIVGVTQRGGRYWYMVKDSGGSPRQGKFGGYMFYDEDYIRLKGLAVVVSRKVVEQTLGRTLGPEPKDDDATTVTASAGS